MSLKHAPCKTLSESDKKKFFPAGRADFAQNFCQQKCSPQMRKECLEEVLSFEEPGDRHGVWGGLTASEREERYG